MTYLTVPSSAYFSFDSEWHAFPSKVISTCPQHRCQTLHGRDGHSTCASACASASACVPACVPACVWCVLCVCVRLCVFV